MSVEYKEHKARSADNSVWLSILERRCEADPPAAHRAWLREHAARYREYAHFLADNGVYVVAPDLRGHGLSEGQRGHVDDYAEYSGC